MKLHQNGDRWCFHCPGCKSAHCINGTWSFDGNMEAPTFSPSILVRWTKTDPVTGLAVGEKYDMVCHSFVRAGKIQFLSDCSHELAGQTVEMPDWDDDNL